MDVKFTGCASSFRGSELKAANYISLTAISVAIGFFSFIYPAIVFSLTVILCAGLIIYLTADEKYRKFLLFFFIVGMALRLVVSIFFDMLSMIYPSIVNLWGDSILVTLRAKDAAYYLATERTDKLMVGSEFLSAPRGTYGYTDYIYYQAIIFYFFGYSPISITFLNSLYGTISAILAFYVAKKLFDVKVAKAALFLCNFFPTLLVWSVTNMREAIFIFLIAVCALALVKLVDGFKLLYALILVLAVIFQGGVRNYVFYIASFSTLIAYSAACRVGLAKKGLAVILIALLLILMPAGRQAIQSIPEYYPSIFTRHIGHINTAGTTYKILDEKYYRSPDALRQMSYGEFGATFARAWFHFLAEPLPFRLETKLQVAAGFPLTIIWYSLLPFSIIGFFQGLFIYKSRGIWALAIYFLMLSSAVAITGGNVGTLIRMRDMVTPFFLIFAASAIVNILSLPKAKASYLQPIRSIS